MGMRASTEESSRRHLPIRILFIACCILCVTSATFAQKRPESVARPVGREQGPDFDAPASAFAGPEQCRDCHKEETVEYDKTSHSKLVFPGKDYIKGCETCHGPAKAHADAVQAAHGDDAEIAKAMKEHPIFAFKGTPAENAARCLNCHVSSKQQELFEHSEHAGPRRFLQSMPRRAPGGRSKGFEQRRCELSRRRISFNCRSLPTKLAGCTTAS